MFLARTGAALDPATGMPAVPEGYYWEVQHLKPDEIYEDEEWPNLYDRYVIKLMRLDHTDALEKEYRDWLGRYKTKTVPAKDEKVCVFDLVINQKHLGSDDKSADKFAARYINKQAVWNAAVEALGLWQTNEIRKQARVELVGTYPPNKL